jgi:hypothetical protein
MSASRYLLEVLLWVVPRCLAPFTLSYSRLPLPLTSRSRISVLKHVRKWSNPASWRRNDGSVWLGCCAGRPDSLLGRRRTADRDAAIEQLGSMFPVSGPYADRVPQTLQCCSSRVLDKMGFLVGWRKGDACSFLSQTVGGHAIAVIMPFLSNVATENSYGRILSSLSEALLPSQICKSSSDQLCTACRLVANQTAMLDFPSVLDSQTTRVRQVYLELDMDARTAHLLDVLSTSWLHILLRCLSNSLRTSNTTTRIRGVAGQVWTLAFKIFFVLMILDSLSRGLRYTEENGRTSGLTWVMTSARMPRLQSSWSCNNTQLSMRTASGRKAWCL